LRGFPDQAIRSADDAIEQADANGNVMVRISVLSSAACLLALQVGDLETAERRIAMLVDLTTKNALSLWTTYGHCLQGMLLLARGDKAGLALLENALNWLRRAQLAFLRAVPVSALAYGLAADGRIARARIVIDEALADAGRAEERVSIPELLRVKGEILRLEGAEDAVGTAEAFFQQAIDEARALGTLSWELRAAMSLAKLWGDGGRADAARELLSGVYGRFTEGVETLDLRTARAQIESLR
jgi:hypothetical protein